MAEDRRKGDRRKTFARVEDQTQQHSQEERYRKFHSLLELGGLIGLNLELNDMLLQISQKTCEVMEADRCSLFLLGAGGEGLGLLRIMTYGQRFNFDISVGSGDAFISQQTVTSVLEGFLVVPSVKNPRIVSTPRGVCFVSPFRSQGGKCCERI